jgi:hypothetical protein
MTGRKNEEWVFYYDAYKRNAELEKTEKNNIDI